MNTPSSSYGNAGLIISDTNSTTEKTSSSSITDFNSSTLPDRKEIYPWMNDKKHGSKKSKSNAKNLNTTSTSSASSSSGKHFFSNFHSKRREFPKTISPELSYENQHKISLDRTKSCRKFQGSMILLSIYYNEKQKIVYKMPTSVNLSKKIFSFAYSR